MAQKAGFNAIQVENMHDEYALWISPALPKMHFDKVYGSDRDFIWINTKIFIFLTLSSAEKIWRVQILKLVKRANKILPGLSSDQQRFACDASPSFMLTMNWSASHPGHKKYNFRRTPYVNASAILVGAINLTVISLSLMKLLYVQSVYTKFGLFNSSYISV